jgi:hypothetical protein
MKHLPRYMAMAAVLALPASLSAQSFNSGPLAGSTCTGNCGPIGANGNIGLSGNVGSTAHGWVSTANGVSAATNNVGFGLGGETNGSKLAYNFNVANNNTSLSFKFQYITSDGTSSFIEYGYAKLTDIVNSNSIILFHARTTPTGNIVPGFGLPPINATIVPASTPVIANQTTWSPLGSNSGACFGGAASGCGRTDWITAQYTVAAAGNYQLEFGVINWGDTAFDSGLAFDFALGQGGVPIVDDPTTVPEPVSASLLLLGLTGLGATARRRRAVRGA